jgi:uncharacterized sulfatase
VEHLEKNGLRENTLIVYLSDNGWEQERQVDYPHSYGGARGKLSAYEQAFRTPLIFNWPGHIEGGQVLDDLVSTVDLYPTLLDFASRESPASRLGNSLRGRLAGKEPSEDSTLIGSTTFLRLSAEEIASAPVPWERQLVFYLTTPKWHYVHIESRGEEQLYDRQHDPKAELNVIESNQALAEDFRSQIESWKASLRDALDLSAPLTDVSD